MKNEGTVDRILRVVAGLGLAGVAWFVLDLSQGAIGGIIAVAVGAIFVVTGLIGFCPGYRLLGLRTCPLKAAAGE